MPAPKPQKTGRKETIRALAHPLISEQRQHLKVRRLKTKSKQFLWSFE
jgi:hypothetical protein